MGYIESLHLLQEGPIKHVSPTKLTFTVMPRDVFMNVGAATRSWLVH